jgi:2-polyprenyl-3-methyl-5-hydroxy-6-metoxy-1,4-benzoquinol methylase
MSNRTFNSEFEKVAYSRLFSTWDAQFLATPEGEKAMQEVLHDRQHRADVFSIKWLARFHDLSTATVVEVGCGTGASTVPLSTHCRAVLGLDIDDRSIRVAVERSRHYGVSNKIRFETVAPEKMLEAALTMQPDADVFLLYAVLEHLTPEERLSYLSTMWKRLPVGGAIVVVETPNRLTWEDKHTTFCDFFHMIPDEFVVRYVDRTRRPGFAGAIKEVPAERLKETRYRWGLGASFHEFEIAFGEALADILVADGLEQEMVDMFPVEADEIALRRYFIDRQVAQPIGFSRSVLNLIFRKPGSESERERNREYNRLSLIRQRDLLTVDGGVPARGLRQSASRWFRRHFS